MSNMLEVRGLGKSFGGNAAVSDVSFTLQPGAVHSVIGPNGAGKSTLFNLITGVYAPSSGTVVFNGEPLDPLPVHERARRGISRTFQNLQVCMDMTARENVMLGAHLRAPGGLLRAMFRFGGVRAAERALHDQALDLLRFVGVSDVDRRASALPYGTLKRLELARALAAAPAFLFLDEPAAGLNPSETRSLGELITAIRDRGITVVLVEHDMKLVMTVSQHVVVLNQGRKLAEGTPAEVRSNPAVITAYLGTASS
jgi:branched-chain amino acid transport system ATP-binding protein